MTTRHTAEASSLAQLGRSLGDPTRAAMAIALLDGRRWRVGELAEVAGVGAPTASDHVACLVDAGIAVVTREGRCSWVELASVTVAETIELMVATAPPPEAATGSLQQISQRRRLEEARTCYDHLAGSLGVALWDAAVAAGGLESAGGVSVPSAGRRWWNSLGVDLERADGGSRATVRECLDWTERRPHVAGAVGAELCTSLFDRRWVRRADRTRRVVVTVAGRDGLATLGITRTDDRWATSTS